MHTYVQRHISIAVKAVVCIWFMFDKLLSFCNFGIKKVVEEEKKERLTKKLSLPLSAGQQRFETTLQHIKIVAPSNKCTSMKRIN